jgi:DNA primase
LFEDFDRIVVACDGDEAGLQFGRRMQDEIGAIPVNLPPGEDVNSVYLSGGREAVEAIVGPA